MSENTSDLPRQAVDTSSEGGSVNSTAEIRAVTLKMFDRIFPLLLFVGTPTLFLAVWRTYEFGRLPTIAAYVAVFIAIVGAIALRHRLPLWIISFVVCAVGVVDGTLTLLSYSFAGAGLLLFSVAVLCATVFFGFKAGLGVFILCAALAFAAAGIMCGGLVPLSFSTPDFLRSFSGWASQLIHFALLTLLAMALVHTIQARLIALLLDSQTRSEDLRAANDALKAEIEARTKAETDLLASENQYRLLAAHMYDIMFQQDSALNMVYVSPSVERMFGYTVEEAMRLTMPQIIAADSLSKALITYRTYLQQAEKGEVTVPLQEYEYIRKDGTTFFGELSVKFLRDEKGRPTGFLGVLRDITDRRRAQDDKERLEQKLRQSEKMEVLGRLAGGIAHDFNNQLAGIMGYAELLGSNKMTPGFHLQASEMIHQCAKRAGDLTGKLLAFARKGAYNARSVDMHDIVREVLGILEHSIDKTVSVVASLDAEKSVVLGDATQLQNALLNLAVNAGDAMPGGGRIHFKTRLSDRSRAESFGVRGNVVADEYLEIRVEDNGIGIDEETFPHIFEPFFTTKADGRGTGMGLAAVHGTAVAHNGAVTVESTPGICTVFTLFLPLSPRQSSPPDSSPPAAAPCGGTLLLIEDEPAVRRVVRLHLESEGYTVESAADGASGIELFHRNPKNFDLVLLDIILPRMDGSGVFDALKTADPAVKIILLSGHTGDVAVAELIKRGAVDFLRKPFTLSSLSAAVGKAILEG